MPELPEVERAAKLLREVAVGKKVIDVEAVEDTIVFSGVSHEEFSDELRGRTVKDAQRYGKVFYLFLDGKGRHPVMHFGMTGMLQVKGQLATYYRETPRKASTDWPPRFMKFILHLKADGDAEETQIAFLDARRLGRVRLCKSPLTEPPISTLGFDPILSMPDLDDFKKGVRKRSCPVKALLLDQSFSAGVGNWVADEILYHARVHPEERCNVLTDDQLEALHKQTSEVCKLAVSVNADDSKFPEDWLFKHRWGKGKKEKHTLTLPDGQPATIKFITVGGRTSAYVAELQKLQRGKTSNMGQSVEDDQNESDLTPLSGDEDAEVDKKVQKVARKLKPSQNLQRAYPSVSGIYGFPDCPVWHRKKCTDLLFIYAKIRSNCIPFRKQLYIYTHLGSRICTCEGRPPFSRTRTAHSPPLIPAHTPSLPIASSRPPYSVSPCNMHARTSIGPSIRRELWQVTKGCKTHLARRPMCSN